MWQGYFLNQKLTKYGSVPYIGSVISCVAGYLTGPPLAVEGRIDFGLDFIYNIFNLIMFFVFVCMYGFMESKWWIIPGIINIILLCLDTWENA